MPTAPRHLRSRADEIPGSRYFATERELATIDRIIAVATVLFHEEGRHNVTLAGLAHALHMTPAAIRRLCSDLDAIFFRILRTHVMDVARTVGIEAPWNQPGRPPRARAAYWRATRDGRGALKPEHVLLLRDRHLLPAELLEKIEDLRLDQAKVLDPGTQTGLARDLLDMQQLTAEAVEAMLPACDTAFAQALAALSPEPTPEPPPPEAAPAPRPVPPSPQEARNPGTPDPEPALPQAERKPVPLRPRPRPPASGFTDEDILSQFGRPREGLALLSDSELAHIGRQPRPPP